jgi:hypothetical protein
MAMPFRAFDFLLQIPETADALAADILPIEAGNIPGRAAENAGRLVLLQHDPIAFHEDFQFVTLGNIQCAAQLNGQNDPAQIVDLSNDTSRLHVDFPLLYNVAFATT